MASSVFGSDLSFSALSSGYVYHRGRPVSDCVFEQSQMLAAGDVPVFDETVLLE